MPLAPNRRVVPVPRFAVVTAIVLAACGSDGEESIAPPTSAFARPPTSALASPAPTDTAPPTGVVESSTTEPATTMPATPADVTTSAPALPAVAPGTDAAFSFTLPTTADAAAVWSVWTDVPNWPAWDVLTDASIDGEFVAGASGTIVDLNGVESRFEVVELVVDDTYLIALPLPNAAIEIRRTFVPGEPNRFTHEVVFTGPDASVFAEALGSGFRADLPVVMDAVRRIAEQGR